MGFIGLVGWLITRPSEFVIGSYKTSLEGRTPAQVYNVRLAAAKINGVIIPPNGIFSFVKIVGSWTADRGFRKAPVSYDGELINSWGGGVCQASSTLYNAALIAGLDIVERYRHHWPAMYAPLGRDAAVAYYDIDLKFKNNLTSSIKIQAITENQSVIFNIISTKPKQTEVAISTQVKSVIKPLDIIQIQNIPHTNSNHVENKLINKGQAGFEVCVYRKTTINDKTKTFLISTDRYPAMNKIIRKKIFTNN